MPELSQGPARLGDPQALPSQTSARLGRAKLTSSLAWLGLLPSLWINVNVSKANRKSQQHPCFSIHEDDGYSNANYLTHIELLNILGQSHSPLLTIILEHAKSNDLFA